MCNGSFSKVFHLFHECSWHQFAAAAGGIYAGFLSLPLFIPFNNLKNSSGSPLPVAINMKNHTSLLPSLLLVSPTTSTLQPPEHHSTSVYLSHVKLHWFVHKGEKSNFLSGLSVPSGRSSECQLNRHIVYWCELLTNLLCVNPDLLFDDMNLNNEGNWLIEPERKFTVLAAPTV